MKHPNFKDLLKHAHSRNVSFKEFIDSLKTNALSFEDFLHFLSFQELSKNAFNLTSEDTFYLIDSINTHTELAALSLNFKLFLDILNILGDEGFKRIVDKFDEVQNPILEQNCLPMLLKNEKLFNFLLKDRNVVSNESLNYIFSKMTSWGDILLLFDGNRTLTTHCLERFVFDEKSVELFNNIMCATPWHKALQKISKKKRDFFETILKIYSNRSPKDVHIQKYFDTYNLLRKFHFSEEQRGALITFVEQSDRIKHNLKQILANNLENQYSFDQLKELITKDEKKKKIKMNF